MNREAALILALGALAVAAALVSIGSWVLLVVESRRRRAARLTEPPASDPGEAQAETPGAS